MTDPVRRSPSSADRSTAKPDGSMMDPPHVLAALMPQVADGDPLAANTLIRTVAPAMLRAIRSVIGSKSPDAEDVLQDGMMRLLKAAGSFRGESSVTRFAVRIALRAAVDAVRSRARTMRLAEQSQHVHERVAPPPGPERTTLVRQQVAYLLQERLSPEQLEVLVLKNALGYRLDEIADATGVPVNTVRGRLQTGKSIVRTIIDGDLRRED